MVYGLEWLAPVDFFISVAVNCFFLGVNRALVGVYILLYFFTFVNVFCQCFREIVLSVFL